MKKIISVAVLLAALALSGAGSIFAQKTATAAEPFNRYFVGSSLFMVMNAVASPSPDFYQLNFGTG